MKRTLFTYNQEYSNKEVLHIKGMTLCKQYFNEIARESMTACFSHIINDIAVGMIGAGSECFGYDDEISRDHDWGSRLLRVYSGLRCIARSWVKLPLGMIICQRDVCWIWSSINY